MKIIPLSEGAFTIDKSKIFVPFTLEKDDLQSRAAGSLLVEIQPFIIITTKDVLLIDCGLGFYENGQLQIYKNLKDNGLDPSAITKVLLTHLHKDHAGGVSYKDRLGNYFLSFPEAKYYVQKREIDYAHEIGYPGYMIEEIGPLTNHPNVILLHEDNGSIDNYIRYELSGGHCPYHQVFWIEENGECIFFGGDVAPQLQQMKSRLVAKYDFDGKKSMQLRQKWWEEGKQQNWTFLFYHDIKNPVYIPHNSNGKE
jgi:glyoxylase-like metal-dependent hydrolase (beta-lactamase superfamily II)